jgi:FMN reductase
LPLDISPIDLRVVLGSTTPPGRMHRALTGAIERTVERGTSADLLDLGTAAISFADGRDPDELDDDTGAAIGALSSARALIVATPIYRTSMSGSLKNLFDLTPVPTLEGKVVGIVAMGASDHHYLGAERNLREVLAFFGAVAMPVAVYLNPGDFDDGVPGERAVELLDELFIATAALSRAIEDALVPRGPSPLAARAIKTRPASGSGST